MKKFGLLSLYFSFILIILSLGTLMADGEEALRGQYVIASCHSKGVHLYVIADTEKRRKDKVQDGKIFLTWADSAATSMDLVVFYDRLKMEMLTRGHLHLNGTVVLPPPLSSALPIDIQITPKMDSGGSVGPNRVICATTAFFEAYH